MHGRHDLPWRKTHDLYRILVSEVMLQQTQVDRVIPFYKSFIKQFPTARRLATAPLREVLTSWQGLGYNRRAKMLHEAAKIIVKVGVPKDVEALEQLPGVGPYTARAVAVFAYNQDAVVIETNIRTAIIHHFSANKSGQSLALAKVSDEDIEKVLLRVLPKGLPASRQGRSREWYSALMDYGAHLKQQGISHNARTKAYAKQSRFAGSLREARGAILRALARGPRKRATLENLLGVPRRLQVQKALTALLAEGLICSYRGTFTLGA